jgi:hypothetical protein
MTHFKTADGQPLIADTTREPVMFWIFNCLFIRVFRSPFSGFPPGSVFGSIAIKAPVSLGFLQFMALSEPRFSVGFSTIFGAGFSGRTFGESGTDWWRRR